VKQKEKLSVGMGTQERKRRHKAMPSPDERYGLGCAIQLLLAIGVLWLFALLVPASRYVSWAFAILLLVGLAMFVVSIAEQFRLLQEVRAHWTSRGIRCLLVHSHSPVWESHISTRWLPRLSHLAQTLDWSERTRWDRSSLSARVFHRICGNHAFNPCVVVFRGLRRPLVFRFYEAFHQAKIGRPQYLEELETKMFESLGMVRTP